MKIVTYDAKTIQEWNAEIAKLKQEKEGLAQSTTLTSLQKVQQELDLQQKIDDLVKNVGAASAFLDILDHNPEALVKQLGDKILDDLTGYTSSHSELPIQIRICMHELKKKLDYIKNVTEKGQPVHIIKIQYVKICALVQYMYDVVRADETHEVFESLKLAKPAFKLKKTDPAFIKLLEDILESSHIGIGGTLPDKHDARSQKTFDYFRDLKAAQYDLFPTAMKVWDHEEKTLKLTHNNNGDIVSSAKPTTTGGERGQKRDDQTATGGDSGQKKEEPAGPASEGIKKPESPRVSGKNDELRSSPKTTPKSPVVMLEEQYNELLIKLRTRPVVQSDLQTKITHAVQAVDAEVQAKQRKKENIDYNFYIELLTHLHNLSQQVTDKEMALHIKSFVEFAPKVTDTHSAGKQLAGLILAIVGLLLIAASITLLMATFSGSSIVSSVGIALGVSLSSSQVVLSATAGVTGAVGAGLTFWGVKKFNEGQGRELAHAVAEVKEEVERPIPAL